VAIGAAAAANCHPCMEMLSYAGDAVLAIFAIDGTASPRPAFAQKAPAQRHWQRPGMPGRASMP
jgi:hypothetical protein